MAPSKTARVLQMTVAPCGHPGVCGCQWAKCCFECPLSDCVFGSVNPPHINGKREAVRNLLNLGLSASEIASELNIHVRTVYHHIKAIEAFG